MAADIDIGAGAAPAQADPDGASAIDLGIRSQGLSFQTRIAVVALMTAVAVLMAACLMFMFEQWRTERSHFIQSQTLLARIVASNAARDIEHDGGADYRADLAGLNVDPRMRSAVIVDLAGRPLAGFQRKAQGAGEDMIEARAPLVRDGKKIGEVILRAKPDPFASLLPRFISMGGALFFVAAGLALFMGRWLAGRLTRPVERLSRAMHDVASSSDFARRVDHGEDDEFGRLTESFNSLLAQLHRNDRELRTTMDALVEARDAAEAANVLKSHFLANMSHEIRTPLNGVIAMAQIMAMGDMTNAQREHLGVIRQSGEALLTVLNDILDLSKIEAGRMELEDVEFEAADLARSVEATHGPLAAKKGLAFSVDLDERAAGVRRGDSARLQQILANLVSNAVKFTASGEVRITIDGEGEDGEDGIRIAVSDSGMGIPAEKLPLLFQKFTQVDSSTTRQFGGTGLGLAICKELAQLMGGSVWAESLQGVGSTFFVRLPLARCSPGRASDGAAPDLAAGPEGEVAQLNILAAEDNPTNQLVLRTVMATFGLEVDIVPDGAQAVEAWRNGAYDLILMDIQMPVLDGISATRMIRADEAQTGRRRTPIIALSANAMTHQVKEYLEGGMDLHVAKPIQLARLQEALEAVMNGEFDVETAAGKAAVA